MTDEPTAEEMEAVAALLSDPALWAEPSPDVEDRVLATISAETAEMGRTAGPAPAGMSNATGDQGGPPDRPDRPDRRSLPRRLVLPLAAAAAVVVAGLAAVSLLEPGRSAEVDSVALAGTEATPTASAIAQIEHWANGDRILLSVDNLPPAPDGFFYAAWVVNDDPAFRVGAGTFHMRGGNGEIELWSGVSTETYRTVSVTLQSVEDPSGPGEIVLRGRLEPDTTG